MVAVFCAIVGVPGSVFSVKIDENESVAELKKAIKKENPTRFQCDAMDLQLYLTKKGDVWLTEAHVKEGLSDTSGLKLLDSMKTKLKVLGLRNENDEEEGEDEGMGLVDVLVVNPQEQNFRPQNEYTRDAPSEFQTLRSTLVDSVINLLFPPTGDHRPLLFFRAPPFSGKSTLCDLLCDRLAKTKPEVLVARVLATRKPSSVSFSEYFKSVYNCELDKFWDLTCDRVLLIDDAHLTYDDVFLWLGLLKNTYERRFRCPRIVLFTSYGSGRHEYNGTDFTVDEFDTFGLNGNDTKPGLQLSRPELDEMIGGSIFAQVRDLIWHLSSAHIGVAHDILSFLAEEFKNKPSESINASEMELALRSVGLMNYMLEKRGIQTYQTFERTVEKEERFRGSYLDINYLTYRTLCGEVVLSTDQTKTLAIEFLIKFGFFYEDENKHLQFPSNMHMKIWLYSKRASSRNIVDFPQEDFVAACISKMSAGANMCNKTRECQIQMDLYGSIPKFASRCAGHPRMAHKRWERV
ncbi:hypothetical protein DVH05_002432 [Phytophthora capsici]|nr:hypothetical protein DVH05_002432 [Phytophthora capsici]